MARVRDEVDTHLKGEPPTIENTVPLRYLQCVIDETLRMYPPIHLGTRRILSDLQFQGYDLPEGKRANYSIYLTQRNPNYWPDPGVFNPDRFLPENERGRQPYTYLPFGGGPRNCIGAAYRAGRSEDRHRALDPDVRLHARSDQGPRLHGRDAGAAPRRDDDGQRDADSVQSGTKCSRRTSALA